MSRKKPNQQCGSVHATDTSIFELLQLVEMSHSKTVRTTKVSNKETLVDPTDSSQAMLFQKNALPVAKNHHPADQDFWNERTQIKEMARK